MTLPPSEQAVTHLQTPQGRIAYRKDGEGPPLLLCQRFRGTIDDWDPIFIQALIAQNRTVIRFDSAGIGRSEGATPDSILGMAETAIAFMDAMHLQTTDILGWSMGGQVAQWIGLKAPHRVRHLVLAATSPGAITEAAPDPAVAAIRSKPSNDLDDILFLFYADSETSRTAGRANAQRVAAQSHGPAANHAAVQAQLAASKAYGAGPDAVRPRLNQLHMPILVANGTQDRMLPPIASFIIATHAPNAKLVLYPDAGHAFLFQHTTQFAADIGRFLSGSP